MHLPGLHADIDECGRNPCVNNGTCIDGVNGFTCNCTREFDGDRCEIGWENIAFLCQSTPASLIRLPNQISSNKRMSLRNGMWNGVRNGIIMRNTIYVGNKLTEERVMFSRQFYKSSSFFDAADSC